MSRARKPQCRAGLNGGVVVPVADIGTVSLRIEMLEAVWVEIAAVAKERKCQPGDVIAEVLAGYAAEAFVDRVRVEPCLARCLANQTRLSQRQADLDREEKRKSGWFEVG